MIHNTQAPASPTAGIPNNDPGHVRRRQALEEAAAADPTGLAADRLAKLKAEPILQFFEFDHLPMPLQVISGPFHATAYRIVEALPRNPERTVALRKLLEAKDCAVRASIYL